MKDRGIYPYRYELFFFSLLLILFGSLFFPFGIYSSYVGPLIFILNILAGLQLMTKQKRLYHICQVIFIAALGTTILEKVYPESLGGNIAYQVKLLVYFFFYSVVTVQLILQVWHAKEVNARAMMALMAGYISLGLVGFFIFSTIEFYHPGSIHGLGSMEKLFDEMIYFSYITLLTIGYGDIYPLTPVAQKAAILIGLVGQFYLVIIMAVVLEKFTRFKKKKETEEI
jgi:hypothetical protein